MPTLRQIMIPELAHPPNYDQHPEQPSNQQAVDKRQHTFAHRPQVQARPITVHLQPLWVLVYKKRFCSSGLYVLLLIPLLSEGVAVERQPYHRTWKINI